MKPWHIICDFDGTISVEDITDALLEKFGTEGWEALENLWRHGEISSRVCMQRQITHLDVDREELDATIDAFRIDPAFPEFVARVRRLGWRISVASDGMDYAIRRILTRHGLGDLPLIANHLVHAGSRQWKLESPHASKSCRVDAGTCKCAHARNCQTSGELVMLVGDGASDFCVAGQVDLVFAKHRLIEHCRTHRINHVPIVGFADAITLLSALQEGETEVNSALTVDKDVSVNE